MILDLREKEQTFRFEGLSEKPIASLFRGFSAPIRVEFERSRQELAFLMAHDQDAFNRWEAGQDLMTAILLEHIAPLQPHITPLFGGKANINTTVWTESNRDCAPGGRSTRGSRKRDVTACAYRKLRLR